MINRLYYSLDKAKFRIPASVLLTASGLALAGCTPMLGGASTGFDRLGPQEAPTVIGPPVRSNFTPMNPALGCFANELQQDGKPKLTIAVDDIKDYTGQYNINEGDAITQGGSLMVMSALGKLGNTINIADRFNTDVTQMELSFMNQRELGNGHLNTVGTGANQQQVPWIPYYGGTIMASKYYITGGITELNYNIQSGGAQVTVNEIGAKDRVYTEDVGIDLELVDTRTLLVVKTVSLVKQITGYEVGAGIFQFFGSNLWDINIGNKSQEPEQLGVRTLLEDGTLQLVAAAENLSPQPCLAQATNWIPRETASQYLAADQQMDRETAAVPAPRVAHTYLVFFDWHKSNLTSAARRVVDEAAVASRTQDATIIHVSGYTDTSGPVAYNQLLSMRRARSVADQLVNDGVPAAVIEIRGYGETHLLVPTGPNVREPRNRRVEIVFGPSGGPIQQSDTMGQAVPTPAPQPAIEGTSTPETPIATPANSEFGQPAPNAPQPAGASTGTLNVKASSFPVENGHMAQAGGPNEIKFDYGSSDVTGADIAEFDDIATAARQHPVKIVLLAPANEIWSPLKREKLLNARIDAVRRSLQIHGIMHMNIVWIPDATEQQPVMDGSGFQRVAIIVVSQ